MEWRVEGESAPPAAILSLTLHIIIADFTPLVSRSVEEDSSLDFCLLSPKTPDEDCLTLREEMALIVEIHKKK